MKALVIGLGVSGRSAVRFLHHHRYEVIGVDRNKESVEKLVECPVFYDTDLSEIDLVILSPGISQAHSLCLQAKKMGIEVIGEIELAARYIEQPCIGITGTNGKTTVTSLVEHVLRCCEIPARAVGNIGIPLTTELLQQYSKETVWVIELSSYQLETLHTPFLDFAAILNITPDHLDRYSSMNEYVSAKARIKDCLKLSGVLYIEDHTYEKYGDFLQGERYSGNSFEEENHKVASLLCSHFGISKDAFQKALQTFKKPPHRLEYVCSISGVSYYNDSKGTNVDAVSRAVEKIEGPVVLIAGGVDKMAPYTPWLTSFRGKVKAVFAIGQAAKRIETEISHSTPVVLCASLEHAVMQAAQSAKAGDAVLLSPGCASFDMFQDYQERGESFKIIVEKMRES